MLQKMATKGDRGMNETCVMCGAELPTECEKQYCAGCEKAVNEPKHIGEIIQESTKKLKNIIDNEFKGE
jgi:hypothetical protein